MITISGNYCIYNSKRSLINSKEKAVKMHLLWLAFCLIIRKLEQIDFYTKNNYTFSSKLTCVYYEKMRNTSVHEYFLQLCTFVLVTIEE